MLVIFIFKITNFFLIGQHSNWKQLTSTIRKFVVTFLPQINSAKLNQTPYYMHSLAQSHTHTYTHKINIPSALLLYLIYTKIQFQNIRLLYFISLVVFLFLLFLNIRLVIQAEQKKILKIYLNSLFNSINNYKNTFIICWTR